MTETITVPYLHYNTKWKEWMLYYLNSDDEWSLEAFSDRASAEREKDLIIRNGFEREISLPGIQKYSEGSYVLCFFDQDVELDNYVFNDRSEAEYYLKKMIEQGECDDAN